MRRIDHLIISELAGPWLFGVAMFTTLILASTLLFKVTEYVVGGISLWTVAELTALFLPAVVVKTFAMAVLLAGLLGFGRLSSDSEVIALKAAGVSIIRMMVPVAAFSTAVAIVAFMVNETVVPIASLRVQEIQNNIARTLDVKLMQPASQPIMRNGKLVGMVAAEDFNLQARTLTGAVVISYDEAGKPNYVLSAKQLEFNEKDFENGGGWHIRGGGEMISFDGTTRLVIDNEAWPSQVPQINSRPEDLLTVRTGDQFDSFSMRQMREYIDKKSLDKNVSQADLKNLEFAYWNKLALPLAALIYGLLGAPLGIRNVRTGTATGFALSITIIFMYVTMTNFMNVYAKGGVIPPYLASFTPLAIGLVCSGVIMWRRNK